MAQHRMASQSDPELAGLPDGWGLFRRTGPLNELKAFRELSRAVALYLLSMMDFKTMKPEN